MDHFSTASKLEAVVDDGIIRPGKDPPTVHVLVVVDLPDIGE